MGRYYAQRRRRSRRRRRRRSTSTIYRAAPAARCRPPAPASPSRWPTSSTRSPAYSRSARSRAAPRIPSACGAPPSARCASSSRRNSISTCARWSRARCALQPVQSAAAATELWDYMVERLRAYFLDAASAGGVAGVTTEMFDAVRASAPVSPLDFAARLARAGEIPGAARGGEPHRGEQAHRQHPQESGSSARPATVDVALLHEPAEKALHEALAGIVARCRARARQTRLQRGARAARHAASGGRSVSSTTSWSTPTTRRCAAIASRCWRSCAITSRASPTCPACRADRTRPHAAGSAPCVFNVFLIAVDAGVRASATAVITPFLSFRGRFWMAGIMTHVVFFALRVLCGIRLHGRRPREPARRQPRDLHEALFHVGDVRNHDPVPATGVGHEARDPVDPVRRLGLPARELHRHRPQGRRVAR